MKVRAIISGLAFSTILTLAALSTSLYNADAATVSVKAPKKTVFVVPKVYKEALPNTYKPDYPNTYKAVFRTQWRSFLHLPSSCYRDPVWYRSGVDMYYTSVKGIRVLVVDCEQKEYNPKNPNYTPHSMIYLVNFLTGQSIQLTFDSQLEVAGYPEVYYTDSGLVRINIARSDSKCPVVTSDLWIFESKVQPQLPKKEVNKVKCVPETQIEAPFEVPKSTEPKIVEPKVN
jgi:hypothetical protein